MNWIDEYIMHTAFFVSFGVCLFVSAVIAWFFYSLMKLDQETAD
ncbi:hypothetical protein [Bacillus songklensis]